DTVAIGALALGATLWPPLAARVRAGRRLAPALVTLVAVVVFASAAAGAGLQPSESAVAWQRWTLFDDSSRAAGVKLVWDASYAGIEFPARRTTVLRIHAPRRSLYWRASTLDRFTADRWIEDLYPVGIDSARRLLPQNPLQPPGARGGRDWVEQRVEVAALVDDHIVGAVEPMRVESDDLERVVYLSGGVMRSARGLAKGQSYTVWSAAARPTPEELVRSPARYPAEARRYLELGRTVLPAFGAAGRMAHVETLFDDVRYQPLWAYRGVWKRALTVAGKAKTPYEATIAIERWLRSQGGFRYEERPPQAVALPPLADFVLRTKQGYCQHFAGAMALMLRLLGIPARVAAGFVPGRYHGDFWEVTDRDAHAWVEVWFRGFGWLPFDPTPGRGHLSGTYSSTSLGFNAEGAAKLLAGIVKGGEVFGSGTAAGIIAHDPRLRNPRSAGDLPLGIGSPVTPEPKKATPSLLFFLLLLAAGVAAVIVLLKMGRRKVRYLTRDPRRVAVACGRELAEFLHDQRVPAAQAATFRELGGTVADRLGVDASSFAQAATAARYGPPEGARQAAGSARKELRDLKRRLRKSLARSDRARGLLSVRSLGLG
ncbi:MAG: transglutaminase family protein, partial [Gaiellaceae bacterium]